MTWTAFGADHRIFLQPAFVCNAYGELRNRLKETSHVPLACLIGIALLFAASASAQDKVQEHIKNLESGNDNAKVAAAAGSGGTRPRRRPRDLGGIVRGAGGKTRVCA